MRRSRILATPAMRSVATEGFYFDLWELLNSHRQWFFTHVKSNGSKGSKGIFQWDDHNACPCVCRSGGACARVCKQHDVVNHRSIYKYLDGGLLSLTIDTIRAPQTHLSWRACVNVMHAGYERWLWRACESCRNAPPVVPPYGLTARGGVTLGSAPYV